MRLQDWTKIRRRELRQMCQALRLRPGTSSAEVRLHRQLSKLEDDLNTIELSHDKLLDWEIPDETR